MSVCLPVSCSFALSSDHLSRSRMAKRLSPTWQSWMVSRCPHPPQDVLDKVFVLHLRPRLRLDLLSTATLRHFGSRIQTQRCVQSLTNTRHQHDLKSVQADGALPCHSICHLIAKPLVNDNLTQTVRLAIAHSDSCLTSSVLSVWQRNE